MDIRDGRNAPIGRHPLQPHPGSRHGSNRHVAKFRIPGALRFGFAGQNYLLCLLQDFIVPSPPDNNIHFGCFLMIGLTVKFSES